MDWTVFVLIIVSVGLVTFGAVLLLFAEMFKGWRQEESNPVSRSNATSSSITEEERLALARPSASKAILSRFTGIFRRGTAPIAGSQGDNDKCQGPPSRASHPEVRG